MMCPAFLELLSDDTIVDHPVALRLYVRLLRAYPLIFVKPHQVKSEGWATALRTHRDRIRAGLNLLIARGYAIEHPPEGNNARRVTFTIERSATDAGEYRLPSK